MTRSSSRPTRRAAGLAGIAGLLLLAACADDGNDAAVATSTADAAAAPGGSASTGAAPDETGATTTFEGTLAAASGGDAVTYDEAAAPAGAELTVVITSADDGTTYELTATGMAPEHGYAVHAHGAACGPTGDAAGPHFQHEQDPAATPQEPSTDPAYANPQNEVWLELSTDADGAGTTTATVPFTFDDRAPQSIVVHADATTMTDMGEAGKAGDRVACLTTPIG